MVSRNKKWLNAAVIMVAFAGAGGLALKHVSTQNADSASELGTSDQQSRSGGAKLVGKTGLRNVDRPAVEPSDTKPGTESIKETKEKPLPEGLLGAEVTHHEPPVRTVIHHPKLGEVVQIKYADGEVLYEPNDPVYALKPAADLVIDPQPVSR